MKQFPISVQLYTLRDASSKDFIDVLKKVASYGYSGVEFAGLNNHPAKEIRKVIDDLGLKASSMHNHMPTKDNAREIIDTAKTLGCSYVVHPYCGQEQVVTEALCIAYGKTLHEASLLFKNQGIKLGFHNHGQEFSIQHNGKYPFDILLESAPDIIAELDTYWAAVGGASVPAVITKHQSRTPLLHIKDGSMVKGQPNTAVGDGTMEWNSVINAADPSVLEWLVVEMDSCATDLFEAIKRSHEFLVKNGFGK